MVQNTNNKNESKITGKMNEKIDTSVDSINRSMKNFSDKVEAKVNQFNEAEFEEKLSAFFVKIGKGSATFFSATIPKIGRKFIQFIKSDRWSLLKLLLVLMIALLILIAIASGIRGLFF